MADKVVSFLIIAVVYIFVLWCAVSQFVYGRWPWQSK